MAFCGNCGAQIQGATRFCPSCGAVRAEQPSQRPPQQQQFQQQQASPSQGGSLSFLQNTADSTEGMDPADIEKNKTFGGLAYFLFFLPLVACPESKYGRFHANQGLLLLILGVGGGIIIGILSAIIGAISWRLSWLSVILSLVFSVVMITMGVIGLMNGFTGKAKELPVIGKIRIIK